MGALFAWSAHHLASPPDPPLVASPGLEMAESAEEKKKGPTTADPPAKFQVNFSSWRALTGRDTSQPTKPEECFSLFGTTVAGEFSIAAKEQGSSAEAPPSKKRKETEEDSPKPLQPKVVKKPKYAPTPPKELVLAEPYIPKNVLVPDLSEEEVQKAMSFVCPSTEEAEGYWNQHKKYLTQDYKKKNRTENRQRRRRTATHVPA